MYHNAFSCGIEMMRRVAFSICILRSFLFFSRALSGRRCIPIDFIQLFFPPAQKALFPFSFNESRFSVALMRSARAMVLHRTLKHLRHYKFVQCAADTHVYSDNTFKNFVLSKHPINSITSETATQTTHAHSKSEHQFCF